MLPRTQPYQTASSGDTHAGLFEDIGTRSLQTVRIGEGAGKIASGRGSAFVGYEAGRSTAGGSFLTLVGYQAGSEMTGSSYSTMIGAYSGRQCQRGSEVVFVGYRSGELNRDGDRLVAIGPYAMRENFSGTGSVAVGYRALERSLDGDYNVAIGTLAGQDMRSGNFCTMAGHASGRASYLGHENCYFGAYSGYSNAYGSGNCFVGYKSGENLTRGDYNVAVGPYAMQFASDGSCNIAIGPFASANASGGSGAVVIGTNAGGNSTTVDYSVVIGTDAGLCNSGDCNVLIGTRVAQHGSVDSTVVIGADAAPFIFGRSSVIIGNGIARSITQGSCNVLLGQGADGYRSTVNSAIAIGTQKTYTSTNSISIGDDIVNERASSILMGYALRSDANNSVIMGNDINIQSVIYWKDPLNVALTDTVKADALTKLGISNISYGQTLQSPSGEVYDNAIVGLITSNIYNSMNLPKNGPVSPISYDLRRAVAPSNYVIAQTPAYPLRTDADVTASISLSNIFSNIDTNVGLSNVQSFQNINLPLSNFLAIHSSNLTVSLQGSSNAVFNVLNFGANRTTLTIPFPKLAAPYHANTVTSNISISTPLPSYTDPSVTFSTTAMDVQIAPDGIHTIPNSSLKFALLHPPTYGKLNQSVFSIGDSVTYRPFLQSAYASQDAFTLRPVLEIVDASGQIYGCPSSNDVRVTVQYPTTPTLFFGSNLYSVNGQQITLTSNVLRTIPTEIPLTTPMRILQMSSNITLSVALSSSYTSNMIAEMVAEEVHLYPDELYISYLAPIRYDASNIIASNQQQFVATYSPLFQQVIPNYTISLSNYLMQTLSNVFIPEPTEEDPVPLPIYTPIAETDPVIADLMNIATLSANIPVSATSNTYELYSAYSNYSNVFFTWSNAYDSNQVYSEIAAIRSSNINFEATYLQDIRYTYDQAVETYANTMSNAYTSNEIRAATNTINDFITLNPSAIAYTTYTNVLSNLEEVNRILRKYYEIPRLFITYQDVVSQRLAFQQIEDSLHAYFTVDILSQNVDYTIHYVADKSWDVFPSALPTITLPRSRFVTTPLSILALDTSCNAYITSHARHGVVSQDESSNVVYTHFDRWMTQDSVHMVVTDSNENSSDTSLNVIYNTDIAYEPSLVIPCPPVSSNLTYEYVSISNIVEQYVALSNVSTVTSSNYDIFGNLVVSPTQTSVSNVMPGEYDVVRGTYVATFDYVTSNILELVTDYEEFNSNIRSNVHVTFDYTSILEVFDGTLSNVIVTSLSNISSNVFDPSIDLTWPLSTSNTTTYLTSNIYYEYTRAFETFIENIAYDQTHFFHFASNNPSYYLYGNDGVVIPRDIPQVSTCNELASRTTVSIFTSNIIQHSNVNVYEPLFPLSRLILYQNDPYKVYQVASASNTYLDVVRSNTGPINTFTQASLDDGDTWLRMLAPSTAPIPVTFTFASDSNISVTTQCLNAAVTPETCSSSNVQATIGLSNSWQTCNLPLWDVAQSLPFVPEKIHIQTIDHGAIHNGTQYSMTFDFTESSNLYYVATSNSFTTDTVSYYFSSNDQTFSPIYDATLLLERDPYTSRQDILASGFLYGMSNQLSSHGFCVMREGISPNALDIVITATSNATINSPRFSMSEVYAGDIYTYVQDIVQGAGFITYDVKSSDDTILYATNQVYTLRPYAHRAFPKVNSATSASNQIRIEQLGNMPHVSNILVGPMWNYLDNVKSVSGGSVPSTGIQVLLSPLVSGFLWDENLEREVPQAIIWEDLQHHHIHYIPYRSNVIPNEVLKLRLVHEDVASPEYTMVLKNYISTFPQTVLDVTVRSAIARQITVPSLVRRSQGLIADGYSWTPNTTIVAPQQVTAPLQPVLVPAQLGSLRSDTFTVNVYTHSVPITWDNTIPYPVTIDQADRYYIDPIVSKTNQNVLEERDIVFYVTRAPEHGIILNTQTRSNVATFTDTDALAKRIIYQHLGTNTSNDSFSLAISSTPYDLETEELNVAITVRQMPFITMNREMFVYHSNVESAVATRHPLSSNLSSSGNGYIHCLSSNVVVPKVSPVGQLNNGQIGFDIPPAYFNAHGTSAPFPTIQMQFSVNQTPIGGYVNPLAAFHPSYAQTFIIPFTAHLNRYVNSNVITEAQSNVQVIDYDVDRSLSASSNLSDRIVSYFLQIKPSNGIFDDTLGLPNVIMDHTEFMRTLDFTIEFVGVNEATLVTLEFFNKYVQMTTPELNAQVIAIPDEFDWTFGNWNNFLFVNEDPDNNEYASLYIGYDVTVSRVQNAERNILRGAQYVIPDLGVIKNIRIRTDMQSSSNYGFPNNVFALPPASNVSGTALGTAFELQNDRTKLQYRNQEVFITTYSLAESLTGSISTTESLNHNVVIGKEITVRGTNNICIGNRFVTSGRNSIIVGNEIGTGVAEVGTINDVYESIIIGNESFQNSVVRDIICIGNRNLNNLFESSVEKVSEFLSQRPILIGNDITQDKLDFSINIGNSFAKTIVGGQQVYIGLNEETVGIGYTSNVRLSDDYKLHVKGDIQCTNLRVNAFQGSPKQIVQASFALGAHPTAQIGDVVVLDYVASNVYYVAATTTSNHKAVFGVIDHMYSSNTSNVVCDICIGGITNVRVNAPFETGDLITTTNILGVAGITNDSVRHSYTLGKVLTNSTLYSSNASNVYLVPCQIAI